MCKQIRLFWLIPYFCALAILPALISRSAASEPVIVHVLSGRTFVGNLDERTSGNHLWLSFGNEGRVIRRPLDWDRVVSLQRGDSIVSGEEFRAEVAQLPAGTD